MVYEYPDDIKATYESPNPFIKWFFNKKINTVLKIADLKKDDLLLDFGCGGGEIKKRLKDSKIKIIGYDLTPEHSDIDNYTKIKPTKIISMDCFEHIPKSEIPKIVENFRKMNPNAIMIFSIPTENFFSRKIRKLLGKPERANGHITTLKEILSIFSQKQMKLIKKKNLFTITFIGSYKFENL